LTCPGCLQSCVVSLRRLLVREKAETTRGGDPSTSAGASGPGGGAGGDVGGRGFYVISESLSASPEMYELQCRSADDRRQCVDRIRAATEQCPQPHDHGTTRPTATQVAWCVCLSVCSTATEHYPSPSDDQSPTVCLTKCANCKSVAEWLACWTQAQEGPGSNRSRDAVG